jgi:hypothetical protein
VRSSMVLDDRSEHRFNVNVWRPLPFPQIQGWRNFGAWHQPLLLPVYVTILVDSDTHVFDSLEEFGLFNIGDSLN